VSGQAFTELEALRLLVGNSTDMLARHAPDGTYRYASPACRGLLGYEPEELVGCSAYEFFHPADLEEITASHDRVLETPDVTTVQYRILHAQGHWVWFETTSHTVRDDVTGEVVEIHTSSRDVTQRRQAQDRLAASEQQFRLAMANAPIGMALVAPDGTWLQVNDRVCEIVGRPRAELLSLTFQDITHPDDLDADVGHVNELLAGERSRYSMEKRYVHARGHQVYVLLSVSLVRDEAGEPRHFIAQIEDITDRKHREVELGRLNAELARSNAELERFAMVASHDLRAPLVTLRGVLDVLPRLVGELHRDARHLLERAIANTDDLLGTVDALLGLARVARGPVELQDVDLAAVVAEVTEVLGPQLGEVGATVEVAELPRVWGDAAQFRLLIQNLLANAVKFRSPDRALQVEVDAVDRGDRWLLTVQDNGRGIAAADRAVIFEPFGRTADGEKVEGAGIGLATCRRIVEHHGGRIEAEPLDEGARFSVTLPKRGRSD